MVICGPGGHYLLQQRVRLADVALAEIDVGDIGVDVAQGSGIGACICLGFVEAEHGRVVSAGGHVKQGFVVDLLVIFAAVAHGAGQIGCLGDVAQCLWILVVVVEQHEILVADFYECSPVALLPSELLGRTQALDGLVIHADAYVVVGQPKGVRQRIGGMRRLSVSPM
mgnify:CR=1 FL=1